MTVREVVRVLKRAGFERARHGKHEGYRHPSGLFVPVPVHTGDVPPGTLRSIFELAGISRERLRELLDA
ncbi:MAG: type II toxin-antitoxin system HicA family toxin [Elusimicrobiota bacterium]|jgi:predicted RNA binding protein YcfA (HicA-like mRNA interferase family)